MRETHSIERLCLGLYQFLAFGWWEIKANEIIKQKSLWLFKSYLSVIPFEKALFWVITLPNPNRFRHTQTWFQEEEWSTQLRTIRLRLIIWWFIEVWVINKAIKELMLTQGAKSRVAVPSGVKRQKESLLEPWGKAHWEAAINGAVSSAKGMQPSKIMPQEAGKRINTSPPSHTYPWLSQTTLGPVQKRGEIRESGL